ncbi:MAG TPA: acylneuraminate cytidylyltransferase family protein [Methylomirabilota bacterium]|nr:acylneuraminate cytidylyltransferase family protein [Methylomirabilota bacterium]
MYAFAVIPARGGSKELPGKNLMRLGRLSLIGHALASAGEAKLLSRVIVSTDDPAIEAEAARQGAEVPFLRPAALATDEAGMVPVLQHAVRWLEESERIRPDLVVLLQPTSPFRTGADIDAVIRKVKETGADSAQTLIEAAYHPFFMSTLDGDRLIPLFPDERGRYVRRQDPPRVYQPSGSVYVTRRRVLMEEGQIVGKDHRGIVMGYEASVKIDTEWEFRLAEAVLAAGRAPIPPERQ